MIPDFSIKHSQMKRENSRLTVLFFNLGDKVFVFFSFHSLP